MDQSTLLKPPYFDPTTLREELTGLATRSLAKSSAGTSDGLTDLKRKIVERLKQVMAEARATAKRQLELDGNGRRCAEGLSAFQDELIRVIYDFTVVHLYRAQNPSTSERMALVATGGYGRGMMAPCSDTDLLFLLPYKQTAWGESVAEHVLYTLWDLGLKVGHATRSVDQCIALSGQDMTIRTALLDARLILGDEPLFAELEHRFSSDVVRRSGRAFVEAKLAERDERHKRSGTSRYLVEPNIKEGKGGLRDLHILHWLAKYLHDAEPGVNAVDRGVFSASEYHAYRRCEDFLWTVRCHLHFLRNRPDERLSFDVQPILAERLGYTQHSGLRSVERFMKHYFLVAKEVGDLTRIVCAALELKQLKSAPIMDQLLAPLDWRRRSRIRKTTAFRIENGRITVADKDVFKRDPVNLIRIFAQAEINGVPFNPDAIRLIRQSLRLIDDNLRSNPEANRIFLEMLTAKMNAERALRKMNEAGVLGRFIPEFGRIVAMMQFNMYHHYTVDEHLIRTVGILSDIEQGHLEGELPLSTNIIQKLQSRRVLYVAAFLHDIAKGRDEDHSIAGARIARELCPRFGLSKSDTETVAWLIEHHLTMSTTAQSRDLNDPKTIADFAQIVQSPERLRLLVILTAADIRAVGPGVWNGWKGQLLRTLYHETEPVLTGDASELSHRERVRRAQQALREALADWPELELEMFIGKHYPGYWLRTDTAKQVEHARLLKRAAEVNSPLMTDFSTDEFTAVTELTVLAPNHPNLLAMIAGACSAAGANIVSAQISTTRDGLALDSFLLQREFERADDEKRRVTRISKSIEKLLRGEEWTSRLLQNKRPACSRVAAFTVEPQVVVDNTVSDEFTVIEVNGLDRPGLLHELTSTLSDLSLDINSAHITTFGEKVVDVFYVTDLTNKKLINAARQAVIRERLTVVLQPEG